MILYKLSKNFESRRLANGAISIDLPEVKVDIDDGLVTIRPLPTLISREMVREAMLMTGEAVGRFAVENDIPIPFTGQEPPAEERPPATSLSEMYAQRRVMKPSKQSKDKENNSNKLELI